MKFCSRAFIFALINSIAIVNVHADAPDAGLGVNDEPLMPDQAFPLNTKVMAADMIRAQWDIADGYYLYRKKFKFTSNTTGVDFDVANFPKGKVKEDEFFGKVETYRGKLLIDIPIKRTQDVSEFDFTVVSQGCADIGVCYPPQKKQLKLTLPKLPATVIASAATADSSESNSLSPIAALKRLGNSLGLSSNDDQFLPPDQAFVFSADVVNGNMLKASWNIEEGYYLYRDKFAFELQDVDGMSIGDIVMPASETKVDESFGEMEVYHNSVDINIPLKRTVLEPTKLTLIAKYQGCADAGLCYPPQKKLMPVSLPGGNAQPQTAASNNTPVSTTPEVVSEQDLLADKIATGSVVVTLLVFFLAGLGLAFTPCVFPMVPILSSIIIGQGDKITTRKAFTMSLVYVLAMAFTYTIAGVIAGIFGENLQAAFQNPWILGTFSAVFVALAFSMFGFYELQMPASIQSKLTEFSNKQEGGTMIGVAIMGFLSALIVGPCVAAPLAGALIYIGQTGDGLLGGMALFALSMGMGAPLIAIGTSAGKLLPRAGNWMDAVKAVFGVLMLAVAIWMLERIVPTFVSMSLWAILLIISAIYMGALEPFGENKSGWAKLWKGVGVTALVYGILILIGVASGGKDVMQPLSNFGMSGIQAGAGNTASHNELAFKQIKGLEQLDQEIEKAKSDGKMVMLDLYADWCISCKEMEKFTFSNPDVQQALKDVVLLQADVTLNDDKDKALLKKFRLVGPPSIMFFDKHGNEKRGYRLVGFLNAEKFLSHINKAKQ